MRLPQPHRTAAKGVQRYIMQTCAPEDGPNLVRLMGDFADLWEGAVADGSSVTDVVGDGAVDFAEVFAATYTGKRWIDKERNRLLASIDEAEQGGTR